MSYWLKKAKDIYPRRDAGNAGISIICRSDFSRSYEYREMRGIKKDGIAILFVSTQYKD